MTKSSINYEFAVDFESKIFNEMLKNTDDLIQRKFIEHIFQKDICLIPRQDESKIICIDVSSQYSDEYNGVSSKLSNIHFNLKDSILTAIEFAVGIGMPETKIQLLKLALLALIKLYTHSTVELSNKECLILLYLHEKGAYHTPVPENEIFKDISDGGLKMSRDEYSSAIKNLKRIASVVIISGAISLKEKIILQYE